MFVILFHGSCGYVFTGHVDMFSKPEPREDDTHSMPDVYGEYSIHRSHLH